MLALVPLLFAATDEIGDNSSYNNEGDAVKLVAIQVERASALTALDFAVYNNRSDGDVHLVLYRLDRNTWVLEQDQVAVSVPEAEDGWAESGEVLWLLEAGATYAMGAYVPDSWYYYYSQRGTADPSFGEALGGVRSDGRAPPAEFEAEPEQYFYYMRVTTENADADEDGAIGAEWGGDDCDDNDPSIAEPTEEVPYDGIDQDCDGADLIDADGDGANASEAGGEDCDDQNPNVSPAGTEICGDGIDQDCSGTDGDCADDLDGDGVPDKGADEIGVELADGCSGCDSGAGAPMGLLIGLAAVLGRRRQNR